MKTYGLVGKSGTGKSFQAMNLCREMNIEGIIDDGLFICGGGVLAGTSAKRQETKVGAIRTALFTDDDHRDAMIAKLQDVQPETLLILGTSEGMVNKIAARLNLPPVSMMIPIEDITTEGQRDLAKKQRYEKGKHLIPAPTFQIKRDFSGYFLDPMRVFRDRSGRIVGERTVVRPTYSYRGEYFISEKVISDIVHHLSRGIPGVASVIRTSTDMNRDGIRIRILIMARYGVMIIDVAKELQIQTAHQVEAMTAFNIIAVDIEIRGLK